MPAVTIQCNSGSYAKLALAYSMTPSRASWPRMAADGGYNGAVIGGVTTMWQLAASLRRIALWQATAAAAASVA